LHKPVLRDVVLSHLNLKRGFVVLDATVGSGGHAEAILNMIGPTGFLIGMDRDKQAIERAQSRLQPFAGHFILKHACFCQMDRILSALNIDRVHAVLMDVGTSSDQLADPARGFSFQTDGPLDMRMDPSGGETAADLISRSNADELSAIFRTYGEERRARAIARAIVRARAYSKNPIRTTRELSQLIEQMTPARFRFGRIHPATRVFQALRIAVNQELEQLESALPKAVEALRPGGRLAVISFHSLEDRIVKWFFRDEQKKDRVKVLTKKPVQPVGEEVRDNPRARSAKLRAIERV
jgi:16S rRNA (cytosine1402-N4)-methyltransferase